MPVFDSRADVIYIGKNLLPVEKEYLKELPYVSSPSEEVDYLIFEKEDSREKFRTWEELKKLYKKYNVVVKSIGQLRLAKNLKEISWNTYTFEEKEKLDLSATKCVSVNIFSDNIKCSISNSKNKKDKEAKATRRSWNFYPKTVLDHKGNSFQSNFEMARYYGVPALTLAKRLERGWSLERALTESIRTQSNEVQDHLGNSFSSETEMFKHYGVSRKTAVNLLRADFPLKDVLTRNENLANSSRIWRDHLNKPYKGLKAMVTHYGLNTSVFYQRQRAGWTLKDTLETPLGDHTNKGVPCKDHLGNEFPSASQMLKHYGITQSAWLYRREHGWSLEESLTIPIGSKKGVTDHLGNQYNSNKEMCKAYNIDYNTFINRYKKGMSLKDALTKPVAPKGKRKRPETKK